MIQQALRSLTTALAIVVAAATSAACLEQKKADPPKAADSKNGFDVQQFCNNNAALIGDARITWQKASLAELEAKIRQSLAELQAKQDEYEAWLRKREDMMRRAADNVATIYAKMRPDSAAMQLAAMDDPVAAAILFKLPPRASSAILNEMEADRAARLTRLMAGSDAGPDGKKS